MGCHTELIEVWREKAFARMVFDRLRLTTLIVYIKKNGLSFEDSPVNIRDQLIISPLYPLLH